MMKHLRTGVRKCSWVTMWLKDAKNDSLTYVELTHGFCVPIAYAPPIRQFPESMES